MGLSTRITLLAFVMVATSAVLVSVIALVGVYGSVQSEATTRLDAYRTLISGNVSTRLVNAEHAIELLAAGIEAVTVEGPGTQSRLAQSLRSNAEAFDVLMVVDGSSYTRLAATGAPLIVPRDVVSTVDGSTTGGAMLVWSRGADDEGRLWVGRRIAGVTSSFTLLAGVRPSYLARAFDDLALAHGSLTAIVLDSAGRPVIVSPGSPLADFGRFDLSGGTDDRIGAVAATATGTPGEWSGTWQRVDPDSGLGWRLAVLMEDSSVFARAGRALWPALLAMLAVVVFAVLASLLYGRRMLGPLTILEQRARDVASGGYVKPIRVMRDDEMGRVAEAFNEMGVRLNSLQDMAQLLATASNLDDVLDAVLGSIGRILGTGEAAVLLSDPSGLALSLVRGRGLAAPEMTLLVPLDEPSAFASSYLEQRVISFESGKDEDGGAIPRLFGSGADRAGVVVPLAIGHEAIGVVVVLAPGRREFSDSQIETLRVFSANAAVAVRTSHLFADERLSRTEAEALRAVAELTVRPGDLGRALESSAAIAADLLGYGGWAVVLENRQQLGLGLPVDRETDRRLIDAWLLVEERHADSEESGHAPIVIADVRTVPGLIALTGPGWRSALFIPVMQGSVARGALVLHDRMSRCPTTRQVSVAGTIGQQLSLAIRNAYLLQQARTRAANLETVFRISQAVSSELQLSAVLNRVLDVVQKILSADAVSLMSYDSERHVIETSMARGVATSDMLYFHTQPGEDIPGRVFALGMPISYGDLSSRSTPLSCMAAQQGFESLLAVPLMARGRPIGVLAVYSKAPSAFSGEDVELLLTFAAQAALAVDTAALYGKEHHVASVLQASILPERLPSVPGLEMASFYLPSGVEAEIGGDYYDVFPTDDGRTVLAIGDVCGKGVVAATKTSMIKYTLRGLIGAGAGPAQALAELNRQVSATGDPADIVTVWVGVLDAAAGTLSYADGGHPPALLLRTGTRVIERLNASGPLLGAMSRATYEERVVDVGVGDLVLLYTDGVTEARRSSRLFGEGRVRRALRGSHTAHECLELLLAAVKKYSVGPLKDDAAALAIRRIDIL